MSKKEIIMWVAAGIAGVVLGIALAKPFMDKENVVWANAQRYAQEHELKVYGNKGSSVFVFNDGTILGQDALYMMYE